MSMSKNEQPIIIAISGISGAGKTTLTKGLSESLNAPAVYWDEFDTLSKFPHDYVEWYERGQHYNEWDYPELANVLEKLKDGESVIHPVNKTSLVANKHLVFDSPLGRLHRQTGKFIKVSVFIKVPLDVALARRLLRDHEHTTDTKQAFVEELRLYLNKSRKLYFAEELRDTADLIVDGMKSVEEQVRTIKLFVSERKN